MQGLLAKLVVIALVATGVGIATAIPSNAAPVECIISGPSGVRPYGGNYSSWSTAWSCAKRGSTGLSIGSAAVFTENGMYGPCNAPHTDSQLTTFFGNTYYVDYIPGAERITSYAVPVCEFNTPQVELYWGIQHNYGAMAVYRVQKDCYGNNTQGTMYQPYGWSMWLTPATTAGRYNITFGNGAHFGNPTHCVTNIGAMPGSSAQQSTSNAHVSIPGSSNHRMRASSLQALEIGHVGNLFWALWRSPNTGVKPNGYAGFTKLADYDWCLRTGNLGPDFP